MNENNTTVAEAPKAMVETHTTPAPTRPAPARIHPLLPLAGVAVATALSARAVRAVSPVLTFENDIRGTGDIKVLNYALALEDLEADLYAQALMRLRDGGTNALGIRINSLGLTNSAEDVEYVAKFAIVEQQHATFLRNAITAAGGPVQPKYKYDFGMQNRTRKQVDDLVYLAEKTGVGAYLGAIKFFATKNFLAVAGAIQGTEARHTAIFADVLNELFNEGLPVAPLAGQNNGIDQPIAPNTVLSSVSPFIVVG
ncbi:MAG TPA: ferritin-like domain-containing protein [Abditibacteriaceae bacterium]|jgi:hypothetical protein